MKKLTYILSTFILMAIVSCSESDTLYHTAAKADFTIGQELYELGEPAVFTDISQPDGNNTIVGWLWEFGDADESTSTEQNPKFTYKTDGSFSVQLTVTDNNGLKAKARKELSILDPAKAINVMWQRDLGGAIENTVSPALSPDEKTVYMYSDQTGNNTYDVKLKAYDVSNGSLKWELNVNDALAAEHPGGVVRLVYGSPSVGPNGDVYIAVRDLKNAGTARCTFLFAIKENGSIRWSYNFGLDGNINYVTPAIDAEGRIYIGHLTTQPFAIVVLNPADGTEIKKIPLTVGVRSGLSLSKTGDIYFCSTGANGLYSYSYDGNMNFNYKEGFATTGGAISMDSDNTVYTVAALSGGGGIVAVNPNGSQKWEYKTPGVIQFGGVITGVDGTIYSNGGKAVEGQTSAGLVALNSDGTLKWHFGTEEDVNNCVPLVDNRGYIHIISDAAVYYILKPDGSLFSSSELGVKTFSSPVMDSKGNTLIAVETEAGVSQMLCITTGAKSYAVSSWPMKGQNPQRQGRQE